MISFSCYLTEFWVIEDFEVFIRCAHSGGIFDTGQIQQQTGIMFIKYASVTKRWTRLKIFFFLKSDVIRCITDILIMEQSNFQSNNPQF